MIQTGASFVRFLIRKMASDEEPEIQSISGNTRIKPPAKRATAPSSGIKKRSLPQAVSDTTPTRLELRMWTNNGRARCAPNPVGKSGVRDKFELVYDTEYKLCVTRDAKLATYFILRIRRSDDKSFDVFA